MASRNPSIGSDVGLSMESNDQSNLDDTSDQEPSSPTDESQVYPEETQYEIEVPLGPSVADICKLLCDTSKIFSRCHMIFCTILHAPNRGFTLGVHNTKYAFHSWDSNATKMKQIR